MSSYKQIPFPALQTAHYKNMRPFDKDLCRELDGAQKSLDAILNLGIRFEDNVDCRIVSFTSNGVANTEDSVAHTLGKVPVGYITVSVDKASIIYAGGTAWTTTAIYLKNSAATVACKIIVF